MSLTTVIIKWTGAYSYEQIRKSDKGRGIYLFAGKLKYERDKQVQYCGITEDYFCKRISDKHHKLDQIRPDTLSIWLGEVHYPTEYDRSLLEKTEHCFVSFWLPKLNGRKTVYYPPEPICFISQWFKQNGQPYLRHPSLINNLSDVLWWDKVHWRTGNLKVSSYE